MQQIWQQASGLLWSIISRPTIVDLLDIIVVAFLLYKLLMLTRDTRASQVLKGLGMLFLIYWASDWLGFKALNWILQLVVSSGAVVIVVLFQVELRRALEQIGRAGSTRFDRVRESQKSAHSIVDELVMAATNMARRRVGALIVIEQRTGLSDVVASGTRIDAEVSAPLIENIFEPNTPLHDGAVIVRGYRIEAAACILPLSEELALARELGTRHRAALSISESTDCLVVIVSEETGIISLARGGRLTRHLDARTLKQALAQVYDSASVNLLSLFLTKSHRKPKES